MSAERTVRRNFRNLDSAISEAGSTSSSACSQTINNKSFQNRAGLISDRAFWIGLAIYAAFLIGAVAAFAGLPNTLNNSGTLYRDVSAQPQIGVAAPLDFSYRGAVTLRSTFGNSVAPGALVGGIDTRFVSGLSLNRISNSNPELMSASALATQNFSSLSSGGMSGLQIAMADENPFAQDVTPVPEPPSWLAAALLAGAFAWSQRGRFRDRLAIGTKRQTVYLALLILWCVFSQPVSATPKFSVDSNIDWQSETVVGNGNIARPQEFGSSSDLFRTPALLTGAAVSTSTASDITLTNNQRLLITGAPGETVTLSLSNFRMSGSSILTLQGTSTTTFVFNVTKQFSLSGQAHIVLGPDVMWSNVIFNVTGKGGTVKLSGSSEFRGILNADQRTVKIKGSAIAYGQVNANKVLLFQAGQIVQPPVTSQ